MASKYKIDDHEAPHFITFATVQWIDILTRPIYKDIIVDSLKYCVKNKGVRLFAYVIMSNHIHLIVSALRGHNLSNFLRDFKKYTSKSIIKEMNLNCAESRRNWMNWLFKSAGQKNPNNLYYQVWQQDNRPIQLSTNEMIDQRLKYLHNNPVKA